MRKTVTAFLGIVGALSFPAAPGCSTGAAGGGAPPTESRRLEIASEVASALAKAAEEHNVMPAALAGLKPGEWIDEPEDFPSCSLISNLGKSLNRSAAMEALAEKCLGMKKGGRTGESNAILAAVGAVLGDRRAEIRAVACEFLAHFPREAVEAGLIGNIGRLLDDKTAVFEAIRVSLEQHGTTLGRLPDKLTVSDAAAAALRWMTTFQFDDRHAFDGWLARNKDFRDRLWYWSLRWSEIRSENEKEAFDDAAEMKPAEAMRLLLLTENSCAKCVDAGLTERDVHDMSEAGPVREAMYYVHEIRPETLAQFIRRNRMKETLLRILRRDPPWPEALGAGAKRCLFQNLPPVLALALDPADAPEIRKALDADDGPMEDTWLRANFVELANALDPRRAEATILEQLEKNPRQPRLAEQLVRATGLKHWDVIEQACPEPSDKESVMEAVAELRTPEAAKALGQWLARHDWTPLLDEEWGYESHSGNDIFLAEFIKTAAVLNGGKAVLDDDLLRRSQWRYGKEGWTAEKSRRANKNVPAARAQAVEALKAFFARAAAGAAAAPVPVVK